MNYQNTLIWLMEMNNYSFLPNYPNHWESLDDMPNTPEVEEYCHLVLSNLARLVKENK